MKSFRHLNYRRGFLAILSFAILIVCFLFVIERLFWKLELDANASMVGHYFAKDAFNRGELMLYEAASEDGDNAFTGRIEDGFEIWTWPVRSGLLSASSKVSDEAMIESFNRAMRNFKSKGEPPYASIIEKRIHDLGSEEPGTRRAAAEALGKMGTRATSAIPALIDALEDDDVFVRVAIIRALAEVGPDARDSLAALRDALDDEDAIVRSNAEQAIAIISVDLP